MGITDSVQIIVSLANAVALQTTSLNIPLIAAFHTHYPDRQRSYSAVGGAGLAQMLVDGFTVNDAAYKAAAIVCSQPGCPSTFIIGRKALKTQQTLTLTMTDSTQGDAVDFTLVGSDGSSHAIHYVIGAAATTTIVAAAVAALINAIPSSSTIFGTTTAALAVITMARVDGLLTDVQGWLDNGFANVQLADTTADPGIATDLAAIQAANPGGFYGVILESNSKAETVAAAAYIESTGQGGKFGFFNNSDFACVNGAVSTDVFSVLKTDAFQRCHAQYNGRKLLCFAGASACSWALGKNPGSYALAQGMSLRGVPADNDVTLPEGQALILNSKTAANPSNGGKGANFYKLTANVNMSFWSLTPSGKFAHTILFVDWLQVNTQADVGGVLASRPILHLTDTDIGLVADAIDTRLQIGASKAFGGIDGTQPIVVTVPTAASIPPADRANGNLPGVSASAHLSGAILTTTVNIVLAA